jgi:hypothetical protein
MVDWMQKRLRDAWFIALPCFAVHCAIGPCGDVSVTSTIGPAMTPINAGASFKFAILGDTHAFRQNFSTALRTAADGGFTDNYANHVQKTYSFLEYGGAFFCILDNSDGQFAPPQLRDCDRRIETFRASNPKGHVFLGSSRNSG